ncbi:MAG: TetR/AcrR family transcriptional regulator [Micrococcaceae bacterium]
MSKERILNNAIAMFTEEGYDKVSMREIAEAAGVTKPALYYHFNSKEDIVATYLENYLLNHKEFINWVQNTQGISSTELVKVYCDFSRETGAEVMAFIRRNHRVVRDLIKANTIDEDIETIGKILTDIVTKEWELEKSNLAIKTRVQLVLVGIIMGVYSSNKEDDEDATFEEIQKAANILLAKP